MVGSVGPIGRYYDPWDQKSLKKREIERDSRSAYCACEWVRGMIQCGWVECSLSLMIYGVGWA